jgi:hypothetical protein
LKTPIDFPDLEADAQKCKKLVWQIERKLAEDSAGGHLLRPPRDLPAALCQRVDGHGQQPLQRLAHRRRLARPVTVGETNENETRLAQARNSGDAAVPSRFVLEFDWRGLQ